MFVYPSLSFSRARMTKSFWNPPGSWVCRAFDVETRSGPGNLQESQRVPLMASKRPVFVSCATRGYLEQVVPPGKFDVSEPGQPLSPGGQILVGDLVVALSAESCQ